ncbi:GntR family transcriptional regulator [Patulibacter sp. S7RM1-6]
MSPSLVQLSSPTLADQAYEALREAIVAGELSRGEKITERGLALRLQVSPTPVREALRRLEQDRLIERTGPRSVRVADFDDADLVEVSAVEDTLRGLAARMAATKATPEQLDAMRAALEAAEAEVARNRGGGPMTPEETAAAAERVFEHTREFHRLLDEASNSELVLHLLKMVEAFDVAQRRDILRRQLASGEAPALDARFTEHREIFEAVAAGDEALAEELVLRHGRDRSARMG